MCNHSKYIKYQYKGNIKHEMQGDKEYDNFDVGIEMEGNKMKIDIDPMDCYGSTAKIKINYCPFCGEKLGD